jgi:predicted membrane-bound spermidine synthase
MLLKGNSPAFNLRKKHEILFLIGIAIRISSITFTYHYSFVAVSLALLGTGVGGTLTNILLNKQGIKLSHNILISAILAAISIQATTILSITILSGENLVGFFLLMSIPFLLWGFGLSLIFRSYPDESGRIYAATLIGSSIGSIASLVFLEQLGGVNTAFIAGAICSLGTLLLVSKLSLKNTKLTRIYIIIIVLIMITISITAISINRNGGVVPVGSNPNKELIQFLKEGWKIVDTRWSAFGRTDIVEHETIEDVKLIFIDGSAGSFMYSFKGDLSDAAEKINQLKSSTAFFPYYFGEKEKILIIGPGGGKDVLIALMGGGQEITGVEINKRIIEVVEDYSSYNGHIYTEYGNVKIIFDEGRSFLTRSQERYDLIVLTLPVTLTSQGLSGYSLVENFLFTQEAMVDYFDHLTQDGRLVIVSHSMPHVYRLVTITLSISNIIENNEIMNHIAIAAEISEDRSYYRFPVFILKKSSFTRAESEAMYSKTEELGFLPIFFPFLQKEGFDLLLSTIADGEVDLESLISSSPINLSPPRDDKPFFYKFEKNLPKSLSNLITASGLVCVLTIVVPLIYLRGKSDSIRGDRRIKMVQTPNLITILMYVSLLGIAFVLIEYALIQKFILFLGNPTLANSLTLAFLLGSSGIGSLFSSRLKNDDLPKTVIRILLVIGILSVIYTFLVPIVISKSLGAGFAFRVFICFLLESPIGFVMGIPFPSSMRLFKNSYQNYLSWFYGVDSVFSVFGIILSVIIALSFGYNGVLIFGGISYLIAYFLFKKMKL